MDKAVLAEALGDDPPPVARIAKEARPPRDPTLPSPAEMRKQAARDKKARLQRAQQSISPTHVSAVLGCVTPRNLPKAAITYGFPC